jgi:hypothetical protein
VGCLGCLVSILPNFRVGCFLFILLYTINRKKIIIITLIIIIYTFTI